MTNCTNNYGPYQFPEKLIPLMILRGLAGQPMPVYGQGRNVRDWLFVDDHAEALWLVLSKGRHRRNLSDRRRVASAATSTSSRRSPNLLDEMAPQRAPSCALDLVRRRSSRPRSPLCDRSLQDQARARLAAARRRSTKACATTVRWYLDNKAWWEPILSDTYRLERLGTGLMTSCRVLVIGRDGQLARELARARWPDGWSVTSRGAPNSICAFPTRRPPPLPPHAPDLVVNAAAYTNVEQAESESDLALLINATGPAAIASGLREDSARRSSPSRPTTCSTARKPAPYAEDDPVNPIGAYGRSKAEGEALIRAALPEHVILRTSWLFSPFGTNFVKTMMRLGAERPELRVVADQRGCPTERRRSGPRHRCGVHGRPIRQSQLRHLSRRQRRRDVVVRHGRGDFRGLARAASGCRRSFRSRPPNIRLRRHGRPIPCSTAAGARAPSGLRCGRGVTRWTNA